MEVQEKYHVEDPIVWPECRFVDTVVGTPTVVPVTEMTKLLGKTSSRPRSGKLFVDPSGAVEHFARTVATEWEADSHRSSTVSAVYKDVNGTLLTIELVCDAAVGEYPVNEAPVRAFRQELGEARSAEDYSRDGDGEDE